jgi:hypothetical protein
MISKMKRGADGSRIAIVFNGSPLFSGGAGSGPSNIRCYEINFTKYFYKYKPLRNLEDIRKDILALETQTDGMIREVIEG